MHRAPTYLLALFLAPLALGPAQRGAADEQSRTDQLQSDQPDSANPDGAASDPGSIMRRALPFLDGQVLHYRTGDGKPDGTARRRGLTIRFYDPDGNFLGSAQRVSQAATRYYGPEGQYLGRRVNQKLSISAEAVVPPPQSQR